jgi:hypothetical protein
MTQQYVTPLQKTLCELQLRLQVVCGQQLTQTNLAEIARTTPRALGEWMRGTSTPKAVASLLNLLTRLERHEDVMAVLAAWRHANEPVPPGRKMNPPKEKRL